MSSKIEPEQAPGLNLPKSSSIVELSIINTTTNLVAPAKSFVQPIIKGHETINMPTFSFILKHKGSGKTILFDIGSRKDWWNFAPSVTSLIKAVIPGLNIKKNVDEILTEGGVDIQDVDGIVWSHWHWDHTGDPSKFPSKAEIIVGPGFKQSFMPGYPKNEKSPMLETDFAGRNVREIAFDSSFKIGQYEAHDFFGDGSFYILNVPGHAVGHISGLARTTPDTFVFLGGDICHFGGSFRPSPYVPMPEQIPADVPLDKDRFQMPCPCSLFTACHPDQAKARTSPYYRVTEIEGSWYVDPPVAQESINKLADFDAHPDVFVAVAHDEGLLSVCNWFPNGTINDWQAKGYKQKNQWTFCNELPIDGKPGRGWLTDRGLMKEGKIEPSNWVPDF